MQIGEFLARPQEWFNTGAAEWVKTYSVYLPEKNKCLNFNGKLN